MKKTYAMARAEVKELLKKVGTTDKILNSDVTAIMEKTGCTITEVLNAINYFIYKK